MEGEEYKFKSICERQFVKNVRKLALEGEFADAEPLSALLGRMAGGDQSDHFPFEWHQAEFFPAR